VIILKHVHFSAPFKSDLSDATAEFTSIHLTPTNSYIIILAVTVGVIPNSINVPLLEANITLIQ